MSDVTRILTAIEQGDAKEADKLLPLVYEELRCLAAQKMSRESPGQTLQATRRQPCVESLSITRVVSTG